MVYSERRQEQEYLGYARFTVSPKAKEQLLRLLRDGDKVYDDGTTVRVVAPVPSGEAATSLVSRVERQLGANVNNASFVPKERALVVDNLEIDTCTKEAYLHSPAPLTAQEIGTALNATLRNHPEALAHIEAVYVRTNEQASYFTARNIEGSITLLSRTAHRDLTKIPVRALVSSGFVVCPLTENTETRYHSVTKTLSINKGKQ